ARLPPVLHAHELRHARDVVVDVGADRLRVPDGVLVGADERLEVAWRAEREAERADAQAGRLLEGGRAAARHPERRVRARPRLGQHVAWRHREETAVVAVGRLAPHAEDLAQRLVEHGTRGVAVGDAEALELVAVRGLGQLDLAQEARVLGAAGIGLDLLARDVRLDEEAELHPAAPSRARARLSNASGLW